MSQNFKISFSLDEGDIAYFRKLFRNARRVAGEQDQAEILVAVQGLIDRVRSAKKTPSFVQESVSILEDLKQMLENLGYEVVAEAGDGQQAVNLARETKPDICILDVKMPVMDGIEAVTIITEENIAPTILLTAYSDKELVDRAKGAGVFAYLVKPFKPGDLPPSIEVARSRFEQLEPVVLVHASSYVHGGKVHDRSDVVAELTAALPTLRVVPTPRVGRLGRVESIGWVLPIDDHSFRIYVVGHVSEAGELAKMRSRQNGKLWEELTEEEHRASPGDYEAMVSQG